MFSSGNSSASFSTPSGNSSAMVRSDLSLSGADIKMMLIQQGFVYGTPDYASAFRQASTSVISPQYFMPAAGARLLQQQSFMPAAGARQPQQSQSFMPAASVPQQPQSQTFMPAASAPQQPQSQTFMPAAAAPQPQQQFSPTINLSRLPSSQIQSTDRDQHEKSFVPPQQHQLQLLPPAQPIVHDSSSVPSSNSFDANSVIIDCNGSMFSPIS